MKNESMAAVQGRWQSVKGLVVPTHLDGSEFSEFCVVEVSSILAEKLRKAAELIEESRRRDLPVCLVYLDFPAEWDSREDCVNIDWLVVDGHSFWYEGCLKHSDLKLESLPMPLAAYDSLVGWMENGGELPDEFMIRGDYAFLKDEFRLNPDDGSEFEEKMASWQQTLREMESEED